VGREKEMALVPAETPKQVLVAGGGPAGLETARVAALRGHRVTLCEKQEKLGGQINIASVPPFMQEMSLLVKYLARQVEKAGVKVELGKEVTAELIKERKPDVVVLATGAVPIVPEGFPGIDKDKVVTAWDILAGHEAGLAQKIVIIGGGLVGCETADFLAQTSDNKGVAATDVTLLEMQDSVALDGISETRHLLVERLIEKRVEVIHQAKVTEILDDGVVYEKDGKEETIHGAECIILAVGVQSVDTLSESIRDVVPEVHVIGDANTPAKALQATAAAAEIGRII